MNGRVTEAELSRRGFVLSALTLPMISGCGSNERKREAAMLGSKPITVNQPIDYLSIRTANLETLNGLGFKVAGNLDIWTHLTQLRPPREIAARLMALDALFLWCAFQTAEQSDASILNYAETNSLLDSMTPDERALFQRPREEARAEGGNTIGWKQENMWPLAWVLGLDKPPLIDGEFINDEVTKAMVDQILPGLEETIDDVLEMSNVRPVAEVVAMHDLFYCAHNAVRNAQLGREGVPDGFDPIVNGGTVHERRHSLKWCLSPGVEWDDTELST